MKLTAGIITLNADFFIEPVLESLYPFMEKIIIADGAVTWWNEQRGMTGSIDKTIDLIKSFPDPENKIKLVHAGVCQEKDEQCRAWFAHVPADTDYVLCTDSDEVHSPDNLEKLIRFLEKEQPTSVGFKSDTFYGGFDRIIGGFERDHSFKRVLKYEPGCWYRTHRQPTLSVYTEMKDLSPNEPYTIDGKRRYAAKYIDIEGKDITGNQLYEQTGITMWHGSYVSPKGVYRKIQYYESAVIAPGKCVPDYFSQVFYPWVMGDEGMKWDIENKNKGVHEFTPDARGDAFTQLFEGVHPPAIINRLEKLKEKFWEELAEFEL